jgi:putative DNA primase/helicase
MRARQEAALAIEDSRRAAYQKWAAAGEARRRQENMLVLAKNLPPIADAGDSWDADPWLLGAQNGVVDLRTGVLRPGRQDDRITMRVRVPYFEAPCPLWESTLKEVLGGDGELISYLQRALGYSLTGDVREEVFFVTWGSGRNGKGTIMNTIGSLLGHYADDLPMSTLAQAERGGGIPNDLAKVAGKRFVTSSEQGGGTVRRLNEDRIKQLTGRDPITARFLHKEFFTFTATLKLWLATNNRPRVRDDSDGFWSRVHLIPFTQSFAGREDKTLKDRLLAEASGIVAWLVQGCLAWQKLGLHPPAVVKDATRDYRQENEPLASFYESCCVVAEGARVQAQQLFTAYTKWCDRNDVPGSFRLNQRTFGENVKRRFPADPANTRHVIYSGVGLREDLLGEQPL